MSQPGVRAATQTIPRAAPAAARPTPTAVAHTARSSPHDNHAAAAAGSATAQAMALEEQIASLNARTERVMARFSM